MVVENRDAFAARYGGEMRIAGQYAGRLANSGERMALVDGNGITLHDFAFDDVWYPDTDGPGQSLVPRSISADKAALQTAAGWRPSIAPTGSPGTKDSLLGDLDDDHRVGLWDLAILQARMNLLTASGPAGGDLDRDGSITRTDLALLTLNYGAAYTPPPPPVVPSAPQSAVVVATRRSVVGSGVPSLAATPSRKQPAAAVDRVWGESDSNLAPPGLRSPMRIFHRTRTCIATLDLER